MPLYITVGHYAMTEDGESCSTIPCESCDTGYHWALLSEVISEFPCEPTSENTYSCSGDGGLDAAGFWLAGGIPYDAGYSPAIIGIPDYVSSYFPILCRLED